MDAALDCNDSGFENIYNISQLDAMSIAFNAWAAVSPLTIANCWHHTRLALLPLVPDNDCLIQQQEVLVNKMENQPNFMCPAFQNLWTLMGPGEQVQTKYEATEEEIVHRLKAGLTLDKDHICSYIRNPQPEAGSPGLLALVYPSPFVSAPLRLTESCNTLGATGTNTCDKRLAGWNTIRSLITAIEPGAKAIGLPIHGLRAFVDRLEGAFEEREDYALLAAQLNVILDDLVKHMNQPIDTEMTASVKRIHAYVDPALVTRMQLIYSTGTLKMRSRRSLSARRWRWKDDCLVQWKKQKR
ncbi:hypothetical protein AG1IA_07385 [Rhizoctonia solani AG-1 IA]|uniref:Uncharacterized protein n=1 Tax=Thanatephorus cucumeris (strain AG1-IA) TaxID=983506 RepID=L8WKX1_THACA|nr:hypothetical protein AG1IA_07385 [Rhizoctonia solani AG-1 IA]